MKSWITERSEPIDGKTSQAVCQGIGERLRQNLRPEYSRLTPRLQHMMEQLRKRDSEHRSGDR